MTRETQKPLELLVVEDNDKHLEDAKSEATRLQTEGARVNVGYARNYKEFEEAMKLKPYDGIVSDVFFPESLETRGSRETLDRCDSLMMYLGSERFDGLKREVREWGRPGQSIEQYLEENKGLLDQNGMQYYEYSKWLRGESLAPLGVLVVKEAKEKNIPVVLCTSTYHHGHATQPVHSFAGDNRVMLIDAYPGKDEYTAEATQKDWKRAFEEVSYQIKR